MRKKSIKWFLGVMATALVLCLGLFSVGCNKENSGDDSQGQEEVEFALNYHILELSLYDTFTLFVENYENVTWTSEDSAIVSVEGGVLTANAYGTVKITASTEENLTDTCIVTVLNEGFVPEIILNTQTEEISLLSGDTFDLSCAVSYNGKTYDDAVFTFTSSQTNVATINENGKIEAVAFGETVITVSAQWRGFDEFYLTKYISVSVMPNVSIDFAISTQELSVESLTVDEKEYPNAAQLTWTIWLDETDVTSTADLTLVNTNKDVAVLDENGLLKAKQVGETEVYLQYTLNEEVYETLPFTVCVSEWSMNGNALYLGAKLITEDVNAVSKTPIYKKENFELNLEDLVGETTDVLFVNGVKTSVPQNGVYSIDKNHFNGENTVIVAGNGLFIEQPFVIVTDEISTKAEFSAFLTTVKQQGYAGYAILTADIDFGGARTADHQGGNSLSGTFNGLGHTVSNVSIHQAAGIFGDIAETGVVKNAAFVGLTADIVGQDKDGRLLANECAGTIENVYVKGAFSEKGLGVLKVSSNTCIIRNCIFDTTQGTPAYPTIIQGNVSGSLQNVYAIGNATAFSTNDSKTPVYENEVVFFDSCKENLTSENGWGEYWEADNYSLYFNGKIIITKAEIVIKDLMYKTSDFDLDLSEFAGGTVDSLFINDVKMPVPENGVLSIKVAEYGGKNTITVGSGNLLIKQPFAIITDMIGTKAEFSSFLTTVKQQGYSGYAVLTANIDFGGEKTADHKEAVASFSGTFDGCGYTVSNIAVHQSAGIFGNITTAGVIKNVAFVGITADISGQINDGRLLANQFMGTLENVYVEGCFQEKGLGVVKMVGSTATIRNCIFNTTQGTPAFPTIVQGDKLGVLENVYAIGNATSIATYDSNMPYENVEAFLTAQKANITAENGWNMNYWNIDESGNLYFGNTKII